jgi:hypothetical protein
MMENAGIHLARQTMRLMEDPMVNMKIELLYFDGCPFWQKGLENIKAVLSTEKIDEEIDLIRIDNDETAIKEKFLGSPSFRIDGQDLWPEERQEYHLGCRLYITEDGLRGLPSMAMLREKFHKLRLSSP